MTLFTALKAGLIFPAVVMISLVATLVGIVVLLLLALWAAMKILWGVCVGFVDGFEIVAAKETTMQHHDAF